jgi:hypothetical protein
MTVEPLHDWEKTGLTKLASGGSSPGMEEALKLLQQMNQNPQAFAKRNTNPMATGYLKQAGAATTAGMAPVTQAEIDQFMNPYTEDVINASVNRLSEAGQKARAAINASQGVRGARSFGDTAHGVRLGEIDKELLSKEGDITASYKYQGVMDALKQINEQRNRSMSGGGQFGNLAGTAQNITSNAADIGFKGAGGMFDMGQGITGQNTENARNTVDAGNYVRTYNQGVNDLIGNDMLAEQGFDANQISQVLNWLKSFESGTDGAKPGTNSLETMGGALSAGAAGLDAYSLNNSISNMIRNNPGIF